MADDKPGQTRDEESKKDTVRINLPAGLAGRTPPPPAKPSDDVKTTIEIKVPGTGPNPMADTAPTALPTAISEDESKKETAVMGKPAVAPKPKSDTSRVQVAAAKPAVPEMPRPTVKLRREEPAAAAPAAHAAATAPAPSISAPQPVMVAAGPSGFDVALSVFSMVLSLAVLVYVVIVSQPA